jgi:peptidoglycan/LPS O-acetylase OafA/YrhL
MVGIFLHGANLLAYCVHAGYGCFKEMPANSFGIYWSLSLEEQFYFFYAFLFFISRGSIRIVIITALLLIAVQLPWARPFPSLGWFIRLDALACGCLLYFFRDSIITALQRCPAWIARLGSASSILVVTFSAIAISQWPAGISVIAGLCAIPVLLAVPQKNLSLSCGKYINGVLEYLGSRSYSIYLSHMPTMRFIQCIGEPSPGSFASDLLYMGLVASCILIFSELGYRFIEMPMRSKGRQMAEKRKRLQGVSSSQSDLHQIAIK